jgi:hypothetical protein
MLKQAHAQSVAHATEDQASSHQAQEKAERTEFELDVTEAPPTSDQLKNILEYLGGSASKVVEGASDESDAMRRLKADGNAFQRPVVSTHIRLRVNATTDSGRWWTGIKAKQVSFQCRYWSKDMSLTHAVAGANESEIMKLVRSVPKET